MNTANPSSSGDSHAVSSEIELENLLPAQRKSKAASDTTDTSHPPQTTGPQYASGLGRRRSMEWISNLSRRARWSSLWLYEIGAIVLSLIFMSAIVVVLKKIDGQPMSSGMPLSPNTLIAIFSTLSKSAILFVISGCLGQLKWVYFEQRGQRLMDLQIFDDASRGPLGSLWLLLRIRWSAIIASCGALLTILALAQDAFYQEVYSTYTAETALHNGAATIARSTSFDYLNLGGSGMRKSVTYASTQSELILQRHICVCRPDRCTV